MALRLPVLLLGFANGALCWRTPANQASDALTYLNETRVNDTTNFVDNWYNQFATGTVGTTFLPAAEELKITADTYADDEEGISLGILGIADHVCWVMKFALLVFLLVHNLCIRLTILPLVVQTPLFIS